MQSDIIFMQSDIICMYMWLVIVVYSVLIACIFMQIL